MSNKANKSKESILVDAKELLKLYDRVSMHLPKARRDDSVLRDFKEACLGIIHHFCIAFEMRAADEQEERRRHIDTMIGLYGEMVALFELMMDMRAMTQKRSAEESRGEMYLFSDNAKLEMARYLERMETGIKKWRSYLRSQSGTTA